MENASVGSEPSRNIPTTKNLFAVQPYQVQMRPQLPSFFGQVGNRGQSNIGAESPFLQGSQPPSPSVDPILAAIASLTDQMKSMSEVLRDVHDISYHHSAKLREHSNTIQQLAGDPKNGSMDQSYLRHYGGPSQASTRETTPLTKPTLPGLTFPGRVASMSTVNSLGSHMGITVPQPYRISPPARDEEHASQPPVPVQMANASPRSPNTTARSIRTPGNRPRRPSMAEAANVHKAQASSRSVAAVSRGRLVKPQQQTVAPARSKSPASSRIHVSSRLSAPTVSSENRSKSPAVHRSKSPARLTMPRASAIVESISPRPSAPLIRYELRVSYNDRIVARSNVRSAMSEDGPFLYVIQSELDPSLSFIPHPEMPCAFSGLSMSVVAINTRTRQTSEIFKSHDSHVDNPPVNEEDGYFGHTCWLSGPSASVVGGVRMFFRRQEEQITLYAMSLKFWFPESTEARAPSFTKDHFRELLKLLGLSK